VGIAVQSGHLIDALGLRCDQGIPRGPRLLRIRRAIAIRPTGCFAHVLRGARAIKPSQDRYFFQRNFLKLFNPIVRSTPSAQKISLPFFRNLCFIPRIPPRQEGARDRHEREAGCGGRDGA